MVLLLSVVSVSTTGGGPFRILPLYMPDGLGFAAWPAETVPSAGV
ncbi:MULTISPECIES: hypothetical protein [unclassified Streptomyces]|nr:MULTISPECIES: hypothetical protein [unclassified Streptomyces]MCX4792363.1 hypothetical protein [Streptomyces sp. NBC_01221]WSJ41470.1 hypothetical protein OG772_36795 [Streptomyces sp. NBC_01321]WSP67715.1 hypothetical protein OG466_39615 [Streptomyces sp. NBC_01240]